MAPLEEIQAAAAAEMSRMIDCDPNARAETKEILRGDTLEGLRKQLKQDVEVRCPPLRPHKRV